MSSLQYASALGRLKALSLNFLTREKLISLAKVKNVNEIAVELQSTWYREEIEKASAAYKPPESVEIALNEHLMKMNRLCLNLMPYANNAIKFYLSKWDIQNIELIIAAKYMKNPLKESEKYFISPREIPVIFEGQLIPYADLKTMIELPDIQSAVNYLVKFPHGPILMQNINEFIKTGDIGILSSALKKNYYEKLLWELRFYRGDEGVLREFIRAEITKQNLISYAKSKIFKLSPEILSKHLIEGGLVSTNIFTDALSTENDEEIIKKVKDYFDLQQAFSKFHKNFDISEFEIELDKLIYNAYLPRLRSFKVSLLFIFWFIIMNEVERLNIRRILYGKYYNLDESYIISIII
jgi:Archaeal/vacuolar-type H+-ATPase subunit C